MPRRRGSRPESNQGLEWRRRILAFAEQKGVIDSKDPLDIVTSNLESISGLGVSRLNRIMSSLGDSYSKATTEPSFLTDLVQLLLAIAEVQPPLEPTQAPAEVQELQAIWHEHVRTVNSMIDSLTERLNTELARINTQDNQQNRQLANLARQLTEVQSQVAEARNAPEHAKRRRIVPKPPTVTQLAQPPVAEPKPATTVGSHIKAVSYREAAHQLHGVELSSVEEWVDRGWLTSGLFGKIGSHFVGITQESIDNFLQNHMPELLNALQGRPSLYDEPEVVRLRQLAEQQATTETETETGLEEELMTQEEAAEFMGVSKQTPKNWTNHNGLASYQREGKLMFKKSDLLAFERPRRGRKPTH